MFDMTSGEFIESLIEQTKDEALTWEMVGSQQSESKALDALPWI